ncbi:MAG: hypothetical protein FJ388_00825, partial [Verrucomicrobia bacterium]|nr:hypothetical protein [Verrucomicrobiota bacterium]
MRSWQLLWMFAAAHAWVMDAAQALDRPDWMDEPGIVMGTNWEEPTFRGRKMGRLDFTLPPEKLADYAREHSPEMIAELKELGVNFVMLHCYKGCGFETERQGMEDAKRFAGLARKAGMRVGAYIGGTMLYERLFKEEPEARQWLALGPAGEPLCYTPRGEAIPYRYAAVKHHPGYIKHLQRAVRFAIEEMRADLIHFDNFGSGGATHDPLSKQQFRSYLKARGMTPAEPPPKTDDVNDPLVRAWFDFRCQALT